MKKENENSVTKHNLKAVQDLKKNPVFGVCPQMRGANSIFCYRLMKRKSYRRVFSVFEEGGSCCF